MIYHFLIIIIFSAEETETNCCKVATENFIGRSRTVEKGGTRKIYFYFVKSIIQENERLTEVGIGLHKQGRVIDRLLKQRLKTRMDHMEEVFDRDSFFISDDTLDMVREEMVKQMVERLEPFKQLLTFQEQSLKYK